MTEENLQEKEEIDSRTEEYIRQAKLEMIRDMSVQPEDDSDEKFVLSTVFKDTISNIFWLGSGAVIIWLIGKYSWLIGTVLFVIYGLIVVADTLHFLIGVLLPTLVIIPAALMMAFRGKTEIIKNQGFKTLKKERFSSLAAIIRAVQVIVGILLSVWLYKLFFSVQ